MTAEPEIRTLRGRRAAWRRLERLGRSLLWAWARGNVTRMREIMAEVDEIHRRLGHG